jgi:hypothetical protein
MINVDCGRHLCLQADGHPSKAGAYTEALRYEMNHRHADLTLLVYVRAKFHFIHTSFPIKREYFNDIYLGDYSTTIAYKLHLVSFFLVPITQPAHGL